ncbi:MAG: hypothetical protein DRN00_02330 [Thermoplasmata archaeon]|nr:MAG: hypothetical protein DRN03_02170 [Thermoplasmata archaeon]RLF39274.1 MAG: hypothetical protein DRN00_02330 [Thermoplasmata archaeon]
MKVKEYLKLARSFNASLTAISPVMGAVSMQCYNLWHLITLFIIGFLGHTYGFVLNDIKDLEIDRHSEEIRDRPLVSGTISVREAWCFAISSMIAAFVIAISLCIATNNYTPLPVLALSALSITVYDYISKKYPLMDIFVATGIFFLILYGAMTVAGSIYKITKLAWIVCILGFLQVIFMQLIAGGLKDIENDFKRGANTLAVKMGVRVVNRQLFVPMSFKGLAYSLQILDVSFVFLSFFMVKELMEIDVLRYLQWSLLIAVSVMMFFFSHKLLNLGTFERDKARKFIGLHYYTNFALAPFLLMGINPWIGIIVIFPALGFMLSNVILHGTLFQPKTM